MRHFIAGVCLLFASAALAQDTPDITAAADWLDLVDKGEYAASWEQAAPLFQSKIKNKDWQESLNETRAPLGAALSRQIIQAEERKRLPGFPRGKYKIFIVETNFSGKTGAIESVTVKNDDDVWRVVGYFIR